MPLSFALLDVIFALPLLSTLTPIATGSTVGYLVNRHGTKHLYKNLTQPPLAPSPWLFPPIWTTLYALMGYAAYHASSTLAEQPRAAMQTLYTTQLVLNHLWMPLFFGLGRPGLAALDILLLGVTVAALMAGLWDGDRTAFWLLVPYAVWLVYATYLNIGVGVLNRWRVRDTTAPGGGGGDAKEG
ncbi:TspO/MBR family protein [Aspergillus lucknowensis]|uniref:TspO/MBR family-domain-containing protein n=1 Tax=Aspergillus lucknowensis TaxID=176173 RepID=A0ABR4LY71_9EURO